MADDERLDQLLDQARAPLLVSIAAALLALEGFLLATAGVQSLLLMELTGLWAVFPPLQLGCGVLAIAAAFGMGKLSGPAGPAALLLALMCGLVSGGWLLASAANLVLSPVVFLAAATSVPAFLLVAVSMFSFFRCVRARKQLRDELQEVVPGSGNLALIAAVGLVGLLVAGVLVVSNLAVAGRPMWVAVAVRGGVDPVADAGFRSEFARQIERRGLVPVVVEETLAADASLDEARKAARKAGAAHVIVFDLTAVQERPGILAGTALHAVTCTATFADAGGALEEVSDPVEFAYERATAGEVVSKVSETLAEAFEPWLVQQLFASEAFAPALAGEVDLEDAVAAMELASMEAAVWDRKAAADGYVDFCELEVERLKAVRASEIGDVKCIEQPCRNYTLIGVDEAGRAIVQEGSRFPLFKIPLAAKNSWIESPERLFAVDPARPEQEVDLLRVSNFYDFGKVDLEGAYASLETFDANQQEAIYTVELGTGKPRDIATLQYRERTSWIQAAPGGNGALVKIKKGPCLLVSSNRRVELPPFSRARWVLLSSGPHFLAQTEDQRIALFDRDGQPGERTARLDGWLAQARATDEDTLVVVTRDGGECGLVTLDAATLAVQRRQDLPRCLKSPQILPDGRLVGIAEVAMEGDDPYDREVVLWDPASEELTQLTTGSLDEETVIPTLDGDRVLFNRRIEDWPPEYDTRTYRRQVCWLDLAP